MKLIHHVVDIDAPTATAWAALTEVHGLRSWWSTRLSTPEAEVGARQRWTFAGDFNPVMEIITLDDSRELAWCCVAGHDPWKDGTFRFQLELQLGVLPRKLAPLLYHRHRQTVPSARITHTTDTVCSDWEGTSIRSRKETFMAFTQANEAMSSLVNTYWSLLYWEPMRRFFHIHKGEGSA